MKFSDPLDRDEYGQVIDSEQNIKDIARHLVDGNSLAFGWSDQEYTHLDLLFVLQPDSPSQGTYMQRGLNPSTDLFVSVMGMGAHGFDVFNRGENRELHHDYVNEKLGASGERFAKFLERIVNEVSKRVSHA